jgi:hypothetical protein
MTDEKPSALRRASTWALLGVPGAVVFFSSVSVAQAQTNVAGWLHLFGIDRIPVALSSPYADLLIRWTAIIMTAVSFILNGALQAIRIYDRKRAAAERREMMARMNREMGPG